MEECGLSRGDRVLVAVSGGPDSQALLDVLAKLSPKMGIELASHGVDHGLRPEARAELDMAEALAEAHGVPFSRSRVRVQRGGNLQKRARDARYEALDAAKARHGASHIATAHHADDRAETVLIRLLSGSGVLGLGVLPSRAGDRIRPFIHARRADITRHLSRHQLVFATDPSNSDRRFLRARVRAEILPVLEKTSPGIVDHLNALSDELLEDRAIEVIDASGRPVALSRAHSAEIRRALRLKRPTVVRLAEGRQVRVCPKSGELRLEPAPELARISPSRARPGPKGC